LSPLLLGITGLLAALDWLAVARAWRRVSWITKPAALAMLIAWFVLCTASLAPGPGRPTAVFWFGAGLLFSLIGDILLMAPGNFFLGGLAAFLLAHLAYILGYNPDLPAFTPAAVPPVVLLSLAVVVWSVRFYRRIRYGLVIKTGGRRLRVGVFFYSIAITAMLLSALLTLFRPEWGLVPAAVTVLGSLLFFISDSILAFDRFVRPISHGRLKVRVTYHLGQIALIAGVILKLKS